MGEEVKVKGKVKGRGERGEWKGGRLRSEG
jgi:hypothetical protein